MFLMNTFLQYIAPHHLLTWIVKQLAHCRWRWWKNWAIKRYIRVFQVDLRSALLENSDDLNPESISLMTLVDTQGISNIILNPQSTHPIGPIEALKRRDPELYERLKGKVELVCLSDTNQVHWEAHQEQGSLNYFDKAFASFQIGGRKADKETFNKILKELEKKPEEILFIDDNEKNIDNAKSLGINVIKYKNSSQLIKDIKTFVSV